MRKYYPTIIIDDPLYDPLTTEGNGYVNVPLHWPYDSTLPAINHWPVAPMKSKTFWFTATTHDLSVKILGSLDGGDTFPVTAEAAFTVAVGAVVVKSIGNDYTALKIQVKPAVDDVHGTLTVTAHGTSAPDTADVEISVQPDVNINGITMVGGKIPIAFPPIKTAQVLATAQSIPAANPATETTLTNAAALDVQACTDIVVAGSVTFGSAAADNAEIAVYGKMASGDSFATLYLDKKTVTASAGNAIPFQFDPLDIRGWSHLKITCKNLDTTPGATHDAACTAKAMLIA